VYNNGWDDENYDYILEKEEVLLGRYVVKNRIGKGACLPDCLPACLPSVFVGVFVRVLALTGPVMHAHVWSFAMPHTPHVASSLATIVRTY
jgi:hypothetical protein